ncbi:hypothetical protein [Pseudoalteromonas pernae]|uniref:hypothetical protein n=1 Tax=Pseudoalteromonas pernae TaxID=3118054 RepID=UPI0032427A18
MTNRELVFSIVTSLVLLGVSLIGQQIGYDSHGFALVATGLLAFTVGNKAKSIFSSKQHNLGNVRLNDPVGEK